MTLKILLIVPDLGLRTDQEIEWIQRTFHTETLAGDVTPARIFEHVTGEHYDVVHIGAHGNEDGVELSNGTMLSMFELQRLARTVEAKLVYLNSCSSARLAQYMVDQGVPAVIATTYKIQDLTAWSVATAFYRWLASDTDFYRAYEAAKPSDGTVSFYSNGNFISRQIQPVLAELASSKAERSQLRDQVRFLLYGQIGTWILILIEGYLLLRGA